MADLSMRISWEDLPSLRAEIERLRARIEGDPSLATYVTVEDCYLQAKRELAEAHSLVDRLREEAARNEKVWQQTFADHRKEAAVTAHKIAAERDEAVEMLTEEQHRHAETQKALIIANTTQANLRDLLRQSEQQERESRGVVPRVYTERMARMRELLRAVAESGVEWSTPGYVLIQVDRATWSAITAAPTPTPAPAVTGFDFPPEAL